jgi:hypothetical protein
MTPVTMTAISANLVAIAYENALITPGHPD